MVNSWPFLGTERSAELSRRELRNRHRRVYRNVYLPRDVAMTPVARAAAAWLWSGRAATVAGLSASALHGARWIDGNAPAELIRRQASAVNGTSSTETPWLTTKCARSGECR